MYDAIVIGARVAGAPTAMLLARKGYRVLLVDRVRFPSDTFRGHFLHSTGAAYLERWGLLDSVRASNCPPVTAWTFDVGPFSLRGSPPSADGVGESYAPRRIVLDKILVDAAVEAGAELRERFTVREVLTDGDRVTGIRGGPTERGATTEEAMIVVGADGLHSLVAKSVRAPVYNAKETLTCCYYSYYSGVPLAGPELYIRDRRIVVGFPTNDGLTCIAVFWPHAEFHAIRAAIETNHQDALNLAPSLAERVAAGTREQPFIGSGDLPNLFRRPFGPGWALVGDAGYHKDPILAQGITDAFRDAESLAAAIDHGLSDRRPMEAALAEYEQRRNDAVMPMYEYNAQLASLEPLPPGMQQLFAALRGNQEQTDRFFGTIVDTVPVGEFYSPENVQRIVSAADQEASMVR